MADRRNLGSTQSLSTGTMSLTNAQTPSSGNAKFGTFFLGRYRVVDEIGLGGMASVHLARADGPGGFQKWVAIKRIHPHLVEDDQFIHMFLDEARIAARISHANVAQVFDLGEGDGTYWIAMEYLHGEPLREVMRCVEEGAPRMQTDVACKVIADAAEGLHAAHDLRGKDGELLGLVHRDVTPHNLFVTYDGNVKVVDFGIAKVAGRLSSTRAGTLKGKLAYMSPEQVRGAEIDRRTDIFALGVVLWELTTGHRLFRMESDLETLEKVQACIVPPPSTIIPDYPVELESIVMRALAKSPDARFQTARDLSRALQQHLLRRGVFVGPEDVAGYVRAIFFDRIKKRDAHLRWAAEVTQTINIDEFRAQQAPPSRGGDSSASDVSMVSYASEVQPAPRPAAGAPAASNSITARPPARGNQQSPRAATPAPSSVNTVAARPAQPPASLAATANDGIRAPAPLPSFGPGSGPIDHYEDDDDENIATIVAPQRLLLPDRAFDRPPASGTPSSVAVAPSLTPTGPAMHAPTGSPFAPMGAPAAVQAPPSYPQPLARQMGGRGDPTMQLAPVKSAKPIALMALLGVAALLIAGGLVTLVALKLRAPAAASSGEAAATAAPPVTASAPVAVSPPPPDSAAPPAASATAAVVSPPSISFSALPSTTTAPKTTASPASTAGGPAPASTKDTGADTPGGNGFLTVVCNPFCDSVIVGGRNLGPSPVLRAPLPPGQQRVTLKKSGSPAKVVPVIIVSGQTSPVRVKMD